uniref:Cytochrome c oxidase subunit 3 n=1 Tax=Leptorhynchoides thecatus TaxID=60532 RepID=Q5DNB4_LEPTH|nr:cytochrome c oxidase subunit III [Leptorhynchoides thecatus]AAT64943.1 cytochrome c oxidase subunit III [Leptorhynchoides thecatus]
MIALSIMPLNFMIFIYLILFGVFSSSWMSLTLSFFFFIMGMFWVAEDSYLCSVWDVSVWSPMILKASFLMFIFTECIFLFSLLFSFIYILAVDTIYITQFLWMFQDCMEIPLFISVILLSSGVSITIFHNMYCGSYCGVWLIGGLVLTLFLGYLFLLVQKGEWLNSNLSWGDGVFGSFFYMITGFHGLHVLMGLFLLSFLLYYVITNFGVYFSDWKVECAVWYWHFVDLVWLLVFLVVYWYSM